MTGFEEDVAAVDLEPLLARLRESKDAPAARDYIVGWTCAQLKAAQNHYDIRLPGSWASLAEAVIMRTCGDEFRIVVDQWRLTYV